MHKAVFLCFLFAFVCGTKRLEAQHITSIKAYSNLAIGESVSIPIFEPSDNSAFWDYRWPSLAVKYQYDTGRFDEFEITNFLVQSRPDEETENRFAIGLRYEHGLNLTKSVNAPLLVSLGGSVRAAYALEQLNELNPIGLAVENEFYSLAFGLCPKLEFLLKHHLVVELSPILDIGNFTVRSEYVYDEFIDEEQRGSLDFYSNFIQVFLRIGAGWRF